MPTFGGDGDGFRQQTPREKERAKLATMTFAQRKAYRIASRISQTAEGT